MKSKIIGLATIPLAFLFTSCKKNDPVNDSTTQYPVSSIESHGLKYQLTWTAFKYPNTEKTPVNGSFNDIKLQYNDKEINIEKALNGAKFSINTESVNSSSVDRDTKLKKFFFQIMKGDIIGVFRTFENNKVDVTLTMNNISKDIPFLYEKRGDTLVLKGKIDIVNDFKANEALKSISDICKELHKNKTWSDVEITTKFYK